MFIDIDKILANRAVIIDDDHEWGYQIRLCNGEDYAGKFLVLTNTRSGSLHFHKNKKETFIVLKGCVVVTYGNREEILKPGDQVVIFPEKRHSMFAKEIPSIILEISTHDENSDTYRIEDSKEG